MKKMINYPKTGQFNDVVRSVSHKATFVGLDENGDPIYDGTREKPTLTFRGTVKLHGCFPSNAKVKMFDGSLKNISQIVPGDLVLGMNEGNALKPSMVLRKFTNGHTDSWVKIVVKCNQMGGDRTITCTPNHKIYTINRGYVPAIELTREDTLLFADKSDSPSPPVLDMLTGKLLGDAHIHKQFGNIGITFGHKEEHEEYIDYCLKFLSKLSNPHKRRRLSGYGTNMIDVSTRHLLSLEYYFSSWLKDGKKIIPDRLVFTKNTLAFWYMDDGSLGNSSSQEDRANFAVCGFNDEECQRIIKSLKCYGFKNPILYKSNGYNRIRLNTKDAYKLFEDIAEIVPPCMQYKLPEELRGRFVENIPPCYKGYHDIPATIKSIETIKSKRGYKVKHDIETDTGNYFVSNILVHNSNAAVCYNGVDTWVQSRNNVIDSLTGHQGFAEFVHSNKEYFTKLFEWLHVTGCTTTVYGEWAGPGIQNGVGISEIPQKMFFVFGVKITPEEGDAYWLDNYDIIVGNERVWDLKEMATYWISVDFNKPGLSTPVISQITEEIENECPIAKLFGVSGVGEGVVFECINGGERLLFKSKGQKHSSSKVKTLAKADTEKLQSIYDFVDYAATENRVEQAMNEISGGNNNSLTKQNTPEILRWIANDIIAEESATLQANNIEWKDVAKEVSDRARRIFFNKLESLS